MGVRIFVVVAAAAAVVGAAAGTGCAVATALRCLRLPTVAASLALFFAPKGRPLLRFVGDGCCVAGVVATEEAAVALVVVVAALVVVAADVPLKHTTSLTGTCSGSDMLTSGSVFTLCAGSPGITVRGPGDALIASGTPATLRRLSLHPLSTAPEADVAPDGPGTPTLEGRLHSALSELRRRFVRSSQGGDPPCGPAPPYGRSNSLTLGGGPAIGLLLVPKSPSLTPFTTG